MIEQPYDGTSPEVARKVIGSMQRVTEPSAASSCPAEEVAEVRSARA